MLGRRFYRVKVMQALYAWFQGGDDRMEVAEKKLLQSIDKFYELYYLQLSFFIDIIDFYRRRTEDAKHKFLPSEEELNPNSKFLDNVVVGSILQNKDLQTQINRFKFSWTEEQEMVRKVFLKVRNSKDLKEYLESDETIFENDRQIVYKIFRKYIAKSGELKFYCDERSIFWEDDFDLAALFIQKTIQMISEGFTEKDRFIDLFSNEDKEEIADEHKFIVELFRTTVAHSNEFEKMIGDKTQNWELERIALTDIILIKMALSELLHFPTIPVKVTMNEYIEISKDYSTPKSKLFINGILDKLADNLQKEKKIKKRGRGLMT
jgi:transcription antitermination protein NusB